MYKLTLLAAFLTFTYADCNFDNWQDYAPNLQNCDLSGQDLSGTDFSYMNLDDADLSNSNLASCDFTGSSMVNANLDGVSIWNTVITDALMCGVDISGFDLGLSMPITESDCFYVCGGSSELDECGVCDGDGTACFGCMDPFATNYSELAIYDDGSCEYFNFESGEESPSLIWTKFLYEYDDQGANLNSSLELNFYTFNREFTSHSCIEAENNSIICKGFYHTYSDIELDYNDGWNGSSSGYEIFSYKLDLNGNIVWFREHGNWDNDTGPPYWWSSNSEEQSYGDIVEYNGYYYFAGYQQWPFYRGFVLKIDEDGNEQWVRFFNPNDSNNTSDKQRDIMITSTGKIIVSAYSNMPSTNEDGLIYIWDESGSLLNHFIYDNGTTYDDRFSQMIELNNGEYAVVGKSYNPSDNNYYPSLTKFNDNGITSSVIIDNYRLSAINDYIEMIQMENGNILYAGTNSSAHALLFTTDVDGNLLGVASDFVEFELGDNYQNSYLRGISKTNDGKYLISGYTYGPLTNYESLMFKVDENLNIQWSSSFGEVLGTEDFQNDIIQLSNGYIITSGYSFSSLAGEVVPSIHKFHYSNGCMNPSACNYNPISTFDNGTCYFEDLCGVCDGNNYDFCDDDSDGVNNFEQWGYGAYNLSVSDIPNDQGGRVYISFDNSYFDSDTLQSRSESYTIERKDGDNWVVAQSFGAYGADSYTVEVTTLENNIDNEFRVIASMDEGNFLSFETILGQSLDNIAPAQPSNLSASFESGQVALTWDSSLDNDFFNYNIYRQSELYATTAESTFADSQLPNMPLLGYSVSATDVNGNESVLSDIDVLIYIDGDLNEDYVLNILDVVMMMEHIMGDELEDIQYADLNNDSAIDILDVVLLVQIILSENRADNE